MKVLFVTSGNSKYHQVMPAFIQTQAQSLLDMGIDLDLYQIKGKGVKGYLRNIIPLRKKLKDSRYDIIHAHYGFCGVIAALARRKEKLVVSFMGESEFVPDKEDQLNILIWFMTLLHRLFARCFFDFVIFKSENLSNFIKGIGHKSVILPNGVNLNVFKPLGKRLAREVLYLPFENNIVLWIGNPSRTVKGYSLAIQAIEKLKIDNPTLHFLAVNNIPNDQLPYYYNATDVFLLSSYSEGSPNVVKEAMACNCPVVSTNVGDVGLLMRGVNGCEISESFLAEEIRIHLEKLLKMKGRSEGRERIIDLGLDSKEIAIRLFNIYQSL